MRKNPFNQAVVDYLDGISAGVFEAISFSMELLAIAGALDPEPSEDTIEQLLATAHQWTDAHPSATLVGTLAFMRGFAEAGATADDLVSRDLDDLWTEMRVRDGSLG